MPNFFHFYIIYDMNIWEEKAVLRFGSIDKSDRLTLGATFGFIQEAAISHAAALGVSREAMAAVGQAWVLSRLSVFIEQRPRYGETVIIRTWPRGPEKLFSLRDYEISDSSGKALIRGRSGWLVIDMEKRRPQRNHPILGNLPVNEGLNALVSGPVGLTARENLAPAGNHTAAYSDVDYFGHVNNVSYVRWVQDLTSQDLLVNANQMRLDINYLNEVLPGENVEFFTTQTDPGPLSVPNDYPSPVSAFFVYEGKKSSAERQPVFRAELFLG